MPTYSRISIIVVTAVGFLARNIHDCAAQTVLRNPRADLIVPNPDFYKEGSNTTGVSFRTDFCNLNLTDQINDGSVNLRSALKGLNLTVQMSYDPSYVNYLNKEDENGFKFIDPDDPGILINIMDEVARKAEFSWRDSWHWMKPPSGNITWTELFVESTNTFDIYAGWAYESINRIDLGLAFPAGWYTGDLIIIARDPDELTFGGNTFILFNWCLPFTFSVWGTLVLTIIMTGLVAVLLQDKPCKKDDKIETSAITKGETGSLIISYLLKSFGAFTGSFELFPNTYAGYILTFSLAFFTLLITSAYTANLASFLVIQQEASLNQVNTVNDIVRMRRTMCVTAGSAVMHSIQEVYKDAAFVQKSGDNEDVLKALRNEECDYAIVGVSAWEENRGVSEVNSECNLSRIGRTFQILEAGFVTKSDAGALCTSLVRDVLNIHFEEMVQDGFIADQWKKTLKAKHDVTDPSCLNSAPVEKDSNVLNITNLGGVFLLHFIFVVLALFVAGWNRWICKSKETSTTTLEDLSERIDHLTNIIMKKLTSEDCEVIGEC